MRYFDPQLIITKSENGRLRDGTFNVDDAAMRGRKLDNGVIELFFDETDEPVIRFHPDTVLTKDPRQRATHTLSMRYIPDSGLKKMFGDTFNIFVTVPTSVKKLGIAYTQGGTRVWINQVGTFGKPGYVSGHYKKNSDRIEFVTDGWVHVVNGVLDSADPLDDRPINETARKVMLKEVQRVRHILRTRAKLGVLNNRQRNYHREYSEGLPILKTLKSVSGEKPKAIEKLLDIILTWNCNDDVNKHAVNCYNNWINRHRKDLYEEFGLYTPAGGGVQEAVPHSNEVACV